MNELILNLMIEGFSIYLICMSMNGKHPLGLQSIFYFKTVKEHTMHTTMTMGNENVIT